MTPSSITSWRCLRWAHAFMMLLLLGACSGGSDAPPPVTPQACSPNNPYRFDALAATTVGSLSLEKDWLYDYFTRQYLWYSEIPAVNAAMPQYSNEADVYGSLDNYFMALRTPALTPSSQRKDRFSFTYPTALWTQLAQGGTVLGYGIEWSIVPATISSPRVIRIAYVHAGSVAASAGLLRGDTLVSVDGVLADDNTASGVNTLNTALFPSTTGSHNFLFSRNNGAQTFTTALPAGTATLDTVPVSQVIDYGNGTKVGYMVFNDHVLPAEQRLIDTMAGFQTAGVTDLVLDLRYNGGGYLFIASELAYMIAGPARTNGLVFERTMFSAKRQAENSDTFFFDTSCFPNASFTQCTNVAALPTLNLGRVFILTSRNTCSASEAIINGLRGVNVDVRLIGSTTCGKPYGFYGQDNCGITYFPIEFGGVNAKGFGDYADGFIPAGTGTAANNVPGCQASDDLNRALGDQTEAMLAAALQLRDTGTCPPVAAGTERPQAAGSAATLPIVPRVAARNGRIGDLLRR